MRVRNWILTIALALGYSAAPTSAQNLVINGDFESTDVFTSPGVPNDGDEVSPGSLATGSGIGIHGWRHYALYGAAGTAFFKSAAQSPFASGNFGAELKRTADGGDSSLDKGGGLEFDIVEHKVYRLLTDVRTPDPNNFVGRFEPQWGSPFATDFRNVSYSPVGDWETVGISANAGMTHPGFQNKVGTRFAILGTGTVHVDNIRFEDVSDPGMIRNINGGFENGADRLIDWKYFQNNGAAGTASISSDAATGDQALLIDRTNASGDSVVQYDVIADQGFGLIPGETVQISFSAKNVSAGSGSTALSVRLPVFGVTGDPNATPGSLYHFGDLVNELVTPSSSNYEDYSFTVTLPSLGPFGESPNIGSAAFRVLGDTGSYLIDDVVITALDGIPGDFDDDGLVTGLDFLAWQEGDSPNNGSSGDLAIWEAAYGGGAISATIGAVPEPSCFVLLGMAMLSTIPLSRSRS